MSGGIKPTRLWHLSGKKHIQYIVQEKINARYPHAPRDMPDLLMFIGITFGATTAMCYAFGMLSPKKDLTTVVRPPGTCDPPKKKKCDTSEKPPPCPPEDIASPSKPCPQPKMP